MKVMDRQGKKYHDLLKTARELFWKHGFRRVSIEEICQKTGISKMTFYRYFKNKIELARAVFDKEVEEGVSKFKEILSDENASIMERMERMLKLKMEGTNEISKEFLQDFYRNPELGLSTYIEETTRKTWADLVKDIRDAQQKGLFRADFKPEMWLIMANKLNELITDERVLQLYDTPQDLVMELARFFTRGIMESERL